MPWGGHKLRIRSEHIVRMSRQEALTLRTPEEREASKKFNDARDIAISWGNSSSKEARRAWDHYRTVKENLNDR